MKCIIVMILFLLIQNKVYSYSAVSINLNDNEIIFNKDEMLKTYPASLTKIMTLYNFAQFVENDMFIFQTAKISFTASNQQEISISLKREDEVYIRDLAIMTGIYSANDAAYALAENIDSSLSDFVLKMNTNASNLNMYSTNFVNPNGLYDSLQYSSAQDIAILLSKFVEKYPSFLGLLNSKGFFYKGNFYPSKNILGNGYKCVKAFKTGFLSNVGYNIAIYVECNGYRIVTVGIGFHSPNERDSYVRQVLDYTIDKISNGSSKKFHLEEDVMPNNSSNAVNICIKPLEFFFQSAKDLKKNNSIINIINIGKLIHQQYLSEYFDKMESISLPKPVIN